jgi:hypothetical protein
MNKKSFVLAGIATMVLSLGSAQAGPCDKQRDAGSGPTVGSTGATTSTSSEAKQHPPTSSMNRAAGEVATSSQDTQRQMQGQPTASQQAEGAKPTGQTAADKGC